MEMASKACQILLFCYHYYTVCLAYCCGHSLFVEWFKCAQIDNFYCASLAIHNIGGSGAGFQDHRAPANNGDAAWPLTDAQPTRFADGLCIVAIGHVPIFRHGRNDVASAIFGRIRTVEATALQEGYGRLRSCCFEHKAFRIE